MNPDEYISPWEYKRLDEIHHQRMNALKDYYYNDDNFDDEANEKKFSEREMELNYEVAKERLRAGLERQFEQEMAKLTDEIDQKEDEIWKLKKEILDMKESIKLIDKMKELLKQYALYSEIDYDKETLTLIL